RRAAADHEGAAAGGVRGGVRAARRRRGLQDRALPGRSRAGAAGRGAGARARTAGRQVAASMTSVLDSRLREELDALREAGTYKHFNTLCSPQGPVVEMEGRGEVLVLSSNNYLGLADRSEVIEAGIEGLRRYGAGTASVRFICGTFEPHLELERELAELVGTEAALTYVSCWNANEAAIPSLTD